MGLPTVPAIRRLFGTLIRGLVPGPSAADVTAQRFLRADGTWADQPTAGVPSSTGNAGKIFTTDGTTPFWADPLAVPNISAAVASRAVADSLFFDGATASAIFRAPLGTAGDMATSPFTLFTWFYNDGVAKTAMRGIRVLSSDPTGVAAQCLAQYISSTDQLIVALYGGTTGDRRTLALASISTTVAVGWHLLGVTWDRLAAPIVSIDGAAQTMTPGTLGASPPNWTDTIVSTYDIAGTTTSGSVWSGGLIPVPIINAVLPQTEVLRYAQTGVLPSSCQTVTGSVVALNSSPWLNSYATNFETFASADGTGFTASDTRESRTNIRVRLPFSGLIYGQKYRARFTPTFSEVAIASVRLEAGVNAGGDPVLSTAFVSGVEQVVEFVCADTVKSGLLVLVDTSANDVAHTLAFSGVKVTKLGPVARWSLDPNNAIRDSGANGMHAVMTAGVSYVGAKVDSKPAAKVSHSGAGDLQFCGGAFFDATKGWVFDRLIVRSSAAVTWSLGNVSAGAQYLSAYSLAVGDNYIPAASWVTRNVSGANLWSHSSGAADITIFPDMGRTF